MIHLLEPPSKSLVRQACVVVVFVVVVVAVQSSSTQELHPQSTAGLRVCRLLVSRGNGWVS